MIAKDIINAWLAEMYERSIKEHLREAHNEHLCAMGSSNNQDAIMHEENADMHRMYARTVNNMLAEVE